MIDVRRLRVLRAVADHGTVTAAADAMHLTPSAVSQQVRALGRDLGVELLAPQGRGIRLTSEGQVLLEHADAMEERWERALADLAAHGEGHTGVLRLTGFPTAVSTLAAPAAARLRAGAPRLSVEVAEADGPPAYEALLSGRADIALTVPPPDGPPADDRRFEQRLLLREPLDLFVPDGHPLAERAAKEEAEDEAGIALAEAAGEDWIASKDECHQGWVVQAACSAAGFTPHYSHRVSDWTGVLALIRAGLGVTLGPRMLPLHESGGVSRVRLAGEGAPGRSIFTVVRRGAADRPAVAHGLEALEKVAEGLAV
ncbi:LysR family transcriptional regulator [Nocardiopsis sp. RSe5-2]|uniref:LysR family transcriptional regulator n=1 Tax=Nocardiopsis endophytica TaxID=3018445 RepID=A0ABT4UBK4_9ACTN|nr:LysR family transcriptional regulator [Nocardiopsis endophytica]MDA2813844.1 LysR family transcriptional regulator [Nocardiopsis endophytica]